MPQPTATATAPPASTGSDEPLSRDLFDLAERMRGVADAPQAVAIPPPAVRDMQVFNVLELPPSADDQPGLASVTAELRAVSEHAYFFFDATADVPQAEVDDAVAAFEEQVWPAVTAAFGEPASPGVDGDPHIVILHANLGSGAAGYVSGDDRYVRAVAPLSNQREMVYIGLGMRPFGSAGYTYVLAHELQHLIHQAHNPDEETWVNEGLSEAAAGLVSNQSSFHDAYLDSPDTPLTTWSELGASAPHYGAASLFIDYLLEQTGGSAADLVAEPADGIAGVEAFMAATGEQRSFADLATDWTVANLLDEPTGPYGYAQLDPKEVQTEAVHRPGAGDGTVSQFAADYLDLLAGDFPQGAHVSFDGGAATDVLPAQEDAHDAFWWSGSGDNIDSMLTRELDLTELSQATLTFRLWYDIERWFDWGQVAVSTDGGATWTAVGGQQTTADDPFEVGYGPGYNGRSGSGRSARWVDERIDLSAYAGAKILLRFELVTNDGTSQPGIAIDDIAVPEAGFLDDADTDVGGWDRQGWRRVTEPLEQRFEVRVVTYGPEPEVRSVPLDGENRGEIDLSGLGTNYPRAVVVIAAVTEGTSESGAYTYEVR